MYRTPRPAETELDAYYSSDVFDNFESAQLFPTERAVREILYRLPRGARILDFGCNTGRLLAALVDRFDCFGIELNATAANVARGRGLRVTELAELASATGTFDAVVTVDVFEHLTNPMPVLATLKDLLKRGGALIIVTGNGDAPVCRVAPAEFWYFRALGHVLMLTRRFASYLAASLDLRLVLWVEMSHYDISYPAAFVQSLRSWAYWSFRRQTLIARVLLCHIPKLRRARNWENAPPVTALSDHVIAMLER
jgi:SAM-dependent methyltransferase